MIAVPALRDLDAEALTGNWPHGRTLGATGKQLSGRADDRQAVLERDIPLLMLLKERAPIGLTRGRMMRMGAAAVFLVQRTR